MKPVKISLTIIFSIFFLFRVNIYSQDYIKKIEKIASEKLSKYATSKEVISAVILQNSQKIPLAKIKERDKIWSSTSGLDGFMKDMLANSCSKYLKSLRTESPYIIESFVMDNQGANVGLSNKTSDYWQGDEDKFIECYNNGNGKIFIGKVNFDESSQAYIVQVSLPVLNKGITIGAVTFGIDISGLN